MIFTKNIIDLHQKDLTILGAARTSRRRSWSFPSLGNKTKVRTPASCEGLHGMDKKKLQQMGLIHLFFFFFFGNIFYSWFHIRIKIIKLAIGQRKESSTDGGSYANIHDKWWHIADKIYRTKWVMDGDGTLPSTKVHFVCTRKWDLSIEKVGLQRFKSQIWA